MTYSFDIFDTCFVRACGSPKNVFDILARRVLGDNIDESYIIDFALTRIKGEKIARENSKFEEVTISEIYEACDFSGLTDMSQLRIMDMELVLEKDLLVPVWELKKRIKTIHEAGGNVIFISDMYLPSHFLLELLKDNGFWAQNDKLYVSSEIKKTKHSGTLYEFIAKENQIKYCKWLHYGDNRHSDYIIPRKMGIKANLIKHNYTFYENKLRNHFYAPSLPVQHVMASISRCIRLKMEKQSPQAQFTTDFIAPLYVAFVYNILQRAQRDNVRKLYFMARDGYILYNIAKIFEDAFPDINLYYFYASRKSLYPDNESPTDQERLILNYLVQEGIAVKENSQTGIVDLRGTRKCHKIINEILSKNGYNVTNGYYLEVLYDRIPIKEAGKYYALWHSERYNANTVLNEAANLLEQYFSITDQCRTIGYTDVNGRVEPVFDEDKYSHLNSELQNLHIDIAKSWAYYFNLCFLNSKYDAVLHNSEFLLNDFICNPRRVYLKMLRNINITDKGDDGVLFVGNLFICYGAKIFGKRYKVPCWKWGSLSLTLGNIGYYILPTLRKHRSKLKWIFRKVIK